MCRKQWDNAHVGDTHGIRDPRRRHRLTLDLNSSIPNDISLLGSHAHRLEWLMSRMRWGAGPQRHGDRPMEGNRDAGREADKSLEEVQSLANTSSQRVGWGGNRTIPSPGGMPRDQELLIRHLVLWGNRPVSNAVVGLLIPSGSRPARSGNLTYLGRRRQATWVCPRASEERLPCRRRTLRAESHWTVRGRIREGPSRTLGQLCELGGSLLVHVSLRPASGGACGPGRGPDRAAAESPFQLGVREQTFDEQRLVPIRSAGEHNAAVSEPQAVWHRVTGVLQCNVCPGPRRDDGDLSLLRHQPMSGLSTGGESKLACLHPCG